MKYAKIIAIVSNTKGGIIMKRVILAVLIVLSCVSFAECAGRFAAFPTVGVCTGSSVRYRAAPNADADIWGKLQDGERVIVDGQTSVDGEVWYEILPKNAQESAYVYGKYLAPCYSESFQESRVGKLIIDILQVYSPYKDYDYYTEYGGEEVKRKYDKSGWLVRVEAWKSGCAFGNDGDNSKNIYIGDSTNKLSEILGDPDKKSDSELVYMAGDSESSLTFRIENGKITRMIYEE